MLSNRQRKRADALCRIMKRISGYDPKRKSRVGGFVTARTLVAYELMAEGLPSVRVAEYFGMNHSSILNYKDRWLSLFMPGWEAERELWEKFKKEI